MSLDALYHYDLSDEIARLPKKPGFRVLPLRPRTAYITFHFSDVVYPDRSEAAELHAIMREAEFHINKDWKRKGAIKPVYGDGYMYDAVILSNGKLVKTRAKPQQLWHCNNGLGNAQSFSAHVLLGRGQDLTPAQRVATFHLFDAVRLEYSIRRTDVVGHCQWPVSSVPPIRSDVYRVAAGQSVCPGPVLFRHVAAYRLATDALGELRTYRVRSGGAVNIRSDASLVRPPVGKLWPGDRFVGVERDGATVTQNGITSHRWVCDLAGRCVWRPLFED